MAVVMKCKMCGGDLVLTPDTTVAECEYCGSVQTVPTQDNEKKLVQFERADRLRRNCEFDKAAGVYESIVADFRQEAEAYWGLVLCKYGIEYVDDPATGKKVPTCHRSSFDSIMDDPNFDQTLENADVVARKVYREEAKVIEEIRKGIIEVSSKEEPYDIFICYKETAEDGGRTLDSVLAQDMYDALTEKGYRVFFSRITLEDKLGQEYEPYIFAALNSAKVMLAVGTDYEYFNAVWVKNEWSRYLKLMAAGQKKTLIPCYKGIDAYDMPKEFAKLQAQDMGKIGAMQDLLRGIDKILSTPKAVKVENGIQEADIQKTIIYNSAMEKMAEKHKKRKKEAYKEAIEKLESISGWKDADEQLIKAKEMLKKLKKKKTIKTLVTLGVIAAIIGGGVFAVMQYQANEELRQQKSYFEKGVSYLESYNYSEAAERFGKAGNYDDKNDNYGSAKEMLVLAQSKASEAKAALDQLMINNNKMGGEMGFYYDSEIVDGLDGASGEEIEIFMAQMASGSLDGQIQIMRTDETRYDMDWDGMPSYLMYDVDNDIYIIETRENINGKTSFEMTLHQGALYVDGKCYYSGKDLAENLYAYAWLMYENGRYQQTVMFMDMGGMAMELAYMCMEDDEAEQFIEQWENLRNMAEERWD